MEVQCGGGVLHYIATVDARESLGAGGMFRVVILVV